MIRSEIIDQVGLVTIDRHERRNALDLTHVEALREAVDDLLGEGVRAMVITGSGSAFCSGADLGGVYGPGFRDALYAALDAISSAPIPVIAAVNGPAIGAGTQVTDARQDLVRHDAVMVVEGGKPVGVLTRADLLSTLID